MSGVQDGMTDITIGKISGFLEIVSKKIEEAFKQGKSVPTTILAKEVAPTFGWEWQHAYHLIGIFLVDRPDLYIKKGPNGGIAPRLGMVAPSEENNVSGT